MFNILDNKPLPGINEKSPFTIISDEAFPLRPLRPYPGLQMYADETEKKFNDRLSRAKKVLEDTFRQLTQKFCIYSKRIKLLPQNTDKTIMATYILHNFIKQHGISTQLLTSLPINTVHNITSISIQEGSAPGDAFEIRGKVKDFICSPLGQLPQE